MNAAAGSNPPAAPAPRARLVLSAIVLSLTVLLYGTGYLLWYLHTPLGRAPQLDGAENLALAARIASGTLPQEPFYRAMLYPALLAIPLKLGATPDNLPALASTFGLLCHFAITLAMALLAARIWGKSPRANYAILLSSALWGLNPVALFYATSVLDVVPSLALFMVGLLWWTHPGARLHDALAGGIFLGLAVAMRPHFLPLVFIAPLARAWLAGRWRPRWPDALAWVGAAVIFIILGFVQKHRSGEFRVLPWQGSYNLYSANKPAANGRYYTQQMFFAELPAGENPARAESEVIYSRFTGHTPPFTPLEMEQFWRREAWMSVEANPFEWLRLMAKKAYYLFNDFDQYNNFTYAWHQARSPWLWWNFLGWGVLLVLAAASLPSAWMQSHDDPARRARLAGLGLVYIIYAGGVLLYYASGRFRLPLAPLLGVVAGGLATIPNGKRVRTATISATLFAACLTFSNFFNARDQSTFIQDEMLTAQAASAVGDDPQAYALAEAGLQRDAARPDLRRIAAISYFNLTLADGPHYDTAPGWLKTARELEGLNLNDATLTLVAGVAAWKSGDAVQAEKIWRVGATRFGANSESAASLLAAQYLRGEAPPGAPPPDPSILAYLKKIPASAAN